MEKRYVLILKGRRYLIWLVLILINILISIYALNTDKKYEEVKEELESLKGRFAITLKQGESTAIELGGKQYPLKLLRIESDPPCNIAYSETPTECVRTGEYDIAFTINGIEFWLDSNFNSSAEIITVNFKTDYVIYYIPEYNKEEATFYIEKDETYEKEKRIIIGDYLIHIDEDNKVTDINTFSKEDYPWHKNYIGEDLEVISKMIDEGVDLRECKQ